MNRAERRRQGIKSKVATYHFTQDQLDAELEKYFRQRKVEFETEIKREYRKNLYVMTVGMGCLVLKEKFGFGYKRMVEYVKSLMYQLHCLDEGFYNIKDIEEQILAETGVCLREEALYVLTKKEVKEMLKND